MGTIQTSFSLDRFYTFVRSLWVRNIWVIFSQDLYLISTIIRPSLTGPCRDLPPCNIANASSSDAGTPKRLGDGSGFAHLGTNKKRAITAVAFGAMDGQNNWLKGSLDDWIVLFLPERHAQKRVRCALFVTLGLSRAIYFVTRLR